MNLVIDIGNTRIRAATFEGAELIHSTIDDSQGTEVLNFLKTINKKFKRCIISAVTEIPKKFKALEKYLETKPLILDDTTLVPFTNRYATKKTLGKDRIAAVAGASFLYSGKNILIIDAGTAITYDFITEKKEYLGGNISPGLTMRFKALNIYTAHLPLIDASDKFGLLGNNTMMAIRNGVQNGLVYELNAYIETFNNKYDNLVVILTGGDAYFFENKLKKTIFVVSNLTLIGLNIILQYNAKKL
jgi:type III pantothenate kinase